MVVAAGSAGKVVQVQTMSELQRLFFRSAGFGAGSVLALALIAGAVFWYRSHPRPWDDHALSATYEDLEVTTQPNNPSYIVEFKYKIQNNTNATYDLNADSLVLMARSPDGSLLREWGHYQNGDPTLAGPKFIPAHDNASVTLRIAYDYPQDFTAADKADMKKLSESLGRRLAELAGIVIFDETRHYRVDLPAAAWQDWDEVKKAKGR